MDDELRKLQEYSEEVERLRIEKRKNEKPITPDTVQSMDVSKYFESDIEDARVLVEGEIEKQVQSAQSLGMNVTPQIEQCITEKAK